MKGTITLLTGLNIPALIDVISAKMDNQGSYFPEKWSPKGNQSSTKKRQFWLTCTLCASF